jgi:tRNA pseudouridine55 synthase
VRSLGRDLARALGTVGTVTALRRTDSGGFTEGEAVQLSAPHDLLLTSLIPLPDAARRTLPAATLTEAGVVEARFGRRVLAHDFAEAATTPRGEPAAWFDGAGALVAIGVQDEESARVLRGFA